MTNRMECTDITKIGRDLCVSGRLAVTLHSPENRWDFVNVTVLLVYNEQSHVWQTTKLGALYCNEIDPSVLPVLVRGDCNLWIFQAETKLGGFTQAALLTRSNQSDTQGVIQGKIC